jgi:hypothetical protein
LRHAEKTGCGGHGAGFHNGVKHLDLSVLHGLRRGMIPKPYASRL